MLRGKITYRLLASLIAALSVCTTLSAQSTRVRGRVTDAASGAPMQFVSVVFPGTTTGITTDEEGIYTLETRDTVGRVQASMVGYATQTKPLTRGGFQPGRLRPGSGRIRHRQRRHHPGREPRTPDPERGRAPQAAEQPRRVRTLPLRHVHQDGARPDERQAALPQQAAATQLRLHLRIHRHVGAHRAGLPAGP